MHRSPIARRFAALVTACVLVLGFARVASSERFLLAQDPPKPATSAPRDEKRDLRVLFVGNSYCYVNDLPALVRELASANPRGPQIAVESVTPGGALLKQHFESTGALEKIRAGGWTHVVLQGQSLEPIMHPDDFQLYAKKLSEEIEKAGAKVVFYQTWARREGASEYAEPWSGGTPKKMQAGLDAAYAKAASAGHGRVVRVGDAWAAALAEKKPPALFADDGSHPSQAGTFLAACVFYEELAGESCVGIAVKREGVSEQEAAQLQKLAHGVVAKPPVAH